MKKALTIVSVFIIIMIALCSCSDTGSTGNQGTGNANAGSSTKLGNYDVVIESCRLAEDYEGDPVVIVKYKFTNNDDDPSSFMFSLDAQAYQDGIGLNEAYILDDSANYSSDNQSKDIKKGATLSVEVAYELNDTTTDVEIEVSELISFSDKKITKKFSIK